MHKALPPVTVLAYSRNLIAHSISGDPPPANKARFLTKHLTTHNASCNDLSASSKTSLFEPLNNIETVDDDPISDC